MGGEPATDIKRATSQIPNVITEALKFPGILEMLACHVDEVLAACRAGVPTYVEVRLAGDPNSDPAEGRLYYRPTYGELYEAMPLKRWQPYTPGERGSEGPFRGHDAICGDFQIFEKLVWVGIDAGQYGGGSYQLPDPNCIGTTLFGEDKGQKISVRLRTAPHLY